LLWRRIAEARLSRVSGRVTQEQESPLVITRPARKRRKRPAAPGWLLAAERWVLRHPATVAGVSLALSYSVPVAFCAYAPAC